MSKLEDFYTNWKKFEDLFIDTGGDTGDKEGYVTGSWNAIKEGVDEIRALRKQVAELKKKRVKK